MPCQGRGKPRSNLDGFQLPIFYFRSKIDPLSLARFKGSFGLSKIDQNIKTQCKNTYLQTSLQAHSWTHNTYAPGCPTFNLNNQITLWCMLFLAMAHDQYQKKQNLGTWACTNTHGRSPPQAIHDPKPSRPIRHTCVPAIHLPHRV